MDLQICLQVAHKKLKIKSKTKAFIITLQELLEVNSKFCAKLQKSLEESVAKGDEVFNPLAVHN